MEKKKYACNTRAKNKWNAENYDRLYPYVKIGKKAVYQKAVEAGGFESLNDLIETATDRIAAEVLGLTPGSNTRRKCRRRQRKQKRKGKQHEIQRNRN